MHRINVLNQLLVFHQKVIRVREWCRVSREEVEFPKKKMMNRAQRRRRGLARDCDVRYQLQKLKALCYFPKVRCLRMLRKVETEDGWLRSIFLFVGGVVQMKDRAGSSYISNICNSPSYGLEIPLDNALL